LDGALKLRNKEVNIFSMSALDLFASALGAFMLLAIVALPFFPNTGDSPQLVENLQAEMQAEIDELREQLESQNIELDAPSDILSQTQEELAQCQAEIPAGDILTSTQNELEACRDLLQQTFVLVVISWGTSDDVDLHIIDPQGNEYYYAARTFPGSDAAFEEDNIQGPGNEIWLSPSAMQGDYEIYSNMYSKSAANPATVRGSILHQNGRIALPDTILSATGEKPLIVTFNVDDQGNVELR
tara:strand:+ start:3348 stop:4073 length:726 start_codon:yes stop_codon:yes gene_type:complete